MAPVRISFLTTCVMLLGSSLPSALAADPVDFGAATDFAILAGSTVTSTGVSGTIVTGDLGVYPGAAVTGFPPAELIGEQNAGNGAAANAQLDLTTAYNEVAGLPFDTTLSGTDLEGLTLIPGVYKFDAAAALTGMLTLDAMGDPNSVFVFQIGSSLQINGNSFMVFKDNVGNADFVYWTIGTSATFGKKTNMMGNFMADQSITLNTGASVLGRLLARIAAVTLDFNTVTMVDSSFYWMNTTNTTNTTNITFANNGLYGSDPNDVAEDENDDELGGGAIAGIVIGSVVVFSAIVGGVAYFAMGGGAAKGAGDAVPTTEL